MTERRESKGDIFARELHRRQESATLDLGSDRFDDVANAAMNLSALSDGDQEPSASNRERFLKMLEERQAQAAAA
ncbi:MAG: hypothetical protein ACD_41C00177G0001 [uncultured bacterium]|nr:MAG: hypothetical protein ACD_41C00177G0001 [uncultured bacterium]